VQAENSVSINRPVEDVFAFLARPENHARFVPGVLEFRLTSSTMVEGAEAVGTRRVFGSVRRLPYRISAFEPNRVLAVATALGPLEGSATYRVEGTAGSVTRVRFVVAGGFRGPLRFADRLLAGTLRRDAATVCRNLKAVLEREPSI
jgi:carbon monoxide dehydrogenase subunit G